MWRYRLFDYPLDGSEGDLGTWCQRVADAGWQLWDAGIGGIIQQEGRMVRRISLRRDGLMYGKTYDGDTALPAARAPR
ncbi:MAG: hypothetical protein ABIO48_16610 [Pedococcus sp.]